MANKNTDIYKQLLQHPRILNIRYGMDGEPIVDFISNITGKKEHATARQMDAFIRMCIGVKFTDALREESNNSQEILNDFGVRFSSVENLCNYQQLMGIALMQNEDNNRLKVIDSAFHRAAIRRGNGIRDENRNFCNSQKRKSTLFNTTYHRMYENCRLKDETKNDSKYICCDDDNGLAEAQAIGEAVYQEEQNKLIAEKLGISVLDDREPTPQEINAALANNLVQMAIKERVSHRLCEEYGIKYIGEYIDFEELKESIDWEMFEIVCEVRSDLGGAAQELLAMLTDKNGKLHPRQILLKKKKNPILRSQAYKKAVQKEYDNAVLLYHGTDYDNVYNTVKYWNVNVRNREKHKVEETARQICRYFELTKAFLDSFE